MKHPHTLFRFPLRCHGPLLGALLIPLLLGACKEAPAPKAAAPAPIVQGQQLRFATDHPQLQLLRVAAATPAQSIPVELPARLVWNEERTQRIYPAFAGRVMAMHADVGQNVVPGTPLATLASPDFGQAQSDTARADADARLTAQTLQRQRDLFNAGIVARKELEQAEAEAERARAEVERAQARTRLYGSSQGPAGDGSSRQTRPPVDQQLHLRASIGGVVVERNLNPGQELRPDMAGPGVPALFVISDPATLWVQVDAREADIGLVRPGTRFVLTLPALPEQTFAGTVITVADFIDPLTRTIKVRGRVDNSGRQLKAEMLATARFERHFNGGLMVPTSATLLHGTRHSVFVQMSPGAFEQRMVTLAHEGPQEVVVSAGLQAGEQVVVDNVLLLARMLHQAQKDAGTTGIGSNDDTTKTGAR